MQAFLWTWTSGLYFLYGRLRDIKSTEPSRPRMLMYWKERKVAITHVQRVLTDMQLSSLNSSLMIYPLTFWIHFIFLNFSLFLFLSLPFFKTGFAFYIDKFIHYTQTYLGSVEFNGHLTEMDHQVHFRRGKVHIWPGIHPQFSGRWDRTKNCGAATSKWLLEANC